VGHHFRDIQPVPALDIDPARIWIQYYSDRFNRIYRLFSYSAFAGGRGRKLKVIGYWLSAISLKENISYLISHQ
jgi:hypothetical protein